MGSPFAENPVLLVNLPEPVGQGAEETKEGTGAQTRASESSNGGSGETLTRAQASQEPKKFLLADSDVGGAQRYTMT